MPTDLYGNRLSEAEWDAAIERTLAELKTDYLPKPHPGLAIEQEGNRYVVGAAGRYFALERWGLTNAHAEPAQPARCLTLSNVGDPVTIRYAGGDETLGRAESCILPAAIGEVTIVPSATADLIVCYVPDLGRDVVSRLLAQGYDRKRIEALGMGSGR